MDNLFKKLQPEFVHHFSQYTINGVQPIRLTRRGQVRLRDGHMKKMGQIARAEDFRSTSWGDGQYLIEGEVRLPEPKCEFMADAKMYNRYMMRNECVRLAAKDARFKVSMLVNKPKQRVHLVDLEPLVLEDFHLEDERGSTSMKYPFNKIGRLRLEPQKHQFMDMLQRELCDKMREMVHRPEIVKDILDQV